MLTVPGSTVRPPSGGIFGVAPESSELATVDEPRDWFVRWLLTAHGGGRIAVKGPRDVPPALVAEANTNPGGWVYGIVGDYGPDDAV